MLVGVEQRWPEYLPTEFKGHLAKLTVTCTNAVAGCATSIGSPATVAAKPTLN